METFLFINVILLWVILIFMWFVLITWIRAIKLGAVPIRKFLDIGQIAPSFEAEDLDGKIVAFSHFPDPSLLLVFVSSTCKACREKISAIDELQDKFRSSGITVVLVSFSEAGRTKKMITKLKITLPVLVAPEYSNTFKQDFKVPATPFYCLIGANHKVEATGYVGNEEWLKLARC